MKTGAEAHFIAGQIFTLGILLISVVPRIPNSPNGDLVGGRQSRNFRKFLLILVGIGTTRTIFFHLRDISGYMVFLDNLMGYIHVTSQTFLCLTTAYLLQKQLVNVINIQPGRSLLPTLVLISVLTIAGSIGSHTFHPNVGCLVNLAEAISCWPVIQTLRLYASVIFVGQSSRIFQGPVITQMLLACEYYYLATSILAFFAEATDTVHEDASRIKESPLAIVAEAVRLNQDNGVDDWTRLLMHAVFQNSMDELQQLSSSYSGQSDDGQQYDSNHNESQKQPDGANKTEIVQRRGGGRIEMV